MKNQIRVILNLPIYKSFNYSIPDHIKSLKLGMRVEVPFGNKKHIGITTSNPITKDLQINKYKLKSICRVIDEKSIITDEIFKICEWSANYYQHPLGQVIFGSLPSKIKNGGALEIKEEQLFSYKVNKEIDDSYFKNKPAQYKLFKMIKDSGTINSDILKSYKLIKRLI